MLVEDPILNARSAYERQFAGQIGANHAVAFGYARTGLWAILSALGLGPGDEVVLSPLTCKVVPLTLLSLQLRAVYADISPETLNLDPAALGRAIGPGTRAVLFQHTYGNGGGLEETARLAAAAGIPLIEDRAQCLPFAPDEIRGCAAIFSNNLLKPLPAASGGVAVTNDSVLGKQLQIIAGRLDEPGPAAMARLRLEAWIHRHVLRPENYWFALKLFSRLSAGYRERPVEEEIASEITSTAIAPGEYQMRAGARWLERAGDWARHRSGCCAAYSEVLAGSNGLELPPVGAGQPLYYFPVRSRRKQELLAEAVRRRIELIAWPRIMPIYPVESESQLRRYGFDPASCPVAMRVAAELIGLPTHDRITPRRREKIIHLLRSFYA